MTVSGLLEITPIPDQPFGATVKLPEGVTDPSKLNDADFDALRRALHENLILVIPNQAELPPASQHALTSRFDPTCEGNYGHDEKLFHHKSSILAKDGKCIPDRPEVIMVGNGEFEAGHAPGMKAFDLEHPTHHSFHKDVLSPEEISAGQTRFYRWHIDSALYGLAPPMVTTLLGIQVPPTTEKQIIKYTDSDEEFELTKGATAFASGATAFKLLSPEEQEFALNTTVVYAPHPYIYISETKATSDGLTIVSEGKEKTFDQLPPWEEDKIKRLPLVWTNPTTKEPHLQVHGCCVWKLINEKTGEVIELEEARKLVHKFMRPAISPQHIYAHPWKKGDLAIFFNRGVWHTVTGEFAPDENRLMHQCNIASGEDPICLK